MAKKVQLMTNAKQWQTVNGVEVLVDVPQEDIDPITDSSCVEIEGHRTLEETINQDNMFTPEIVETKVHSKVGGVYHDNVVDGAYEEAILYGNTQVNLVESVTTGIKYIPHSFTSFQGNESKIGNYHSGRTNQVAPLVKGVTMVNLAQKNSIAILEGSSSAIENIKSNTKYTITLDFTVQNTQKGFSIQCFKDNTYLETSMIRTNMEEKVKFTFTTHEEANTIYIVNNSGYGGEIQLDNIMVIEGDMTDLDIPFFKGMRSVELSRPLTNLFTDNARAYSTNSTYTNMGGNITVTSTTVSSWNMTQFYIDNLKQNTKYIAMWDNLTTTQTATTQQEILVCAVCVQDNVKLGGINEDVKCPTLRSMIFDTRDKDLSQIVFRIHASMSNSEATSTTITGLRVFEWDDSLRALDLQGIGYFSGTKYVSVRALETEGKNLYPYGDVNFTNDYVGWCDAKGKTNMYGDITKKSSTRFLLKKGTYTFTVGGSTNTNPIYIVSDKEEFISDLEANKVFTLTQDTYCTLRVKTVEANVATTVTNIQIERGETATTYEAYQSRYYKPRETEEIILRSLPNGVCDTFNLQTGELVQNIGEVVLDGSEVWMPSESFTSTFNSYYSVISNSAYINNLSFINDNLITLNGASLLGIKQGFYMGNYIGQLAPFVSTALSTVDELKTYLQSNPITVQYELAEPIITKLQTYDRIYKGQTNALANMGNNLSALTYYTSNYYLKVGNLSPIPTVLESITSVPYDVRLKPSTLYTIKYNRGGYSNSMKFDLGGSVVEKTNATSLSVVAEELTVKTPAILSHEQLILSGTGYAHNFIVVEGDITGTELPYFEGMKDVKMPVVKNIGKNLFNPNIIGDSGQYIRNDMGSLVQDNTSKYTVGHICVQPNTKYYLYVKGLQRVYFLDNNKNWISRTGVLYQQGTQTHTTNTNFTTGANCYHIQIQYRVDELDLTNATLVEYGDNNPHVEHKENSIYITQGEIPITSEMIEQGGFSSNNPTGDGSYEKMKYGEENTNYSKRLRSKDLIPVKPNTTYQINANSVGGQLMYSVYQWNGNREFMDGSTYGTTYSNIDYTTPLTFTTHGDARYIHLLYKKSSDSKITVAEYDWNNFHMYELDSTINLRSLPNGVKDELNLLTGEYIQRVGEVVLDGGEEQQWFIGRSSNANLLDFYIHNIIPNALDNGNGISDKFNYVNGVWNVNVAGICVNVDKGISMMLPTKYVKTQDLQGCLEWLQSNPVTVQYELEEPITSHVRLVSNNQEREVGVKLPNGVCDTYNPATGITTVRVGKIVLDGSEDEGWEAIGGSSGKGVLRFETTILSGKFNGVVDDNEIPTLLCDKYATYKFYDIYRGNAVGITFYYSSHIVIYDNKYTDLASFKQALQSNPITVWYELKYPQIQPDIVLPNGVHDEYNPETGVYTKRVGFIEFDGSADENWGVSSRNGEITSGNYCYYYNKYSNTISQLPKVNTLPLCDKLSASLDNIVADNPMYIAIGKAEQEFRINIPSGESSATACKQWLVANPIKVWYELATPITYQLTPYFGLPQPYAYEDGYLIHDSAYPETTLPPEFKYKLVANRTGQVMQNSRKLQEHTTRLSNLEALIIEATIESLFDRELQMFELELMDIQLIDLGE